MTAAGGGANFNYDNGLFVYKQVTGNQEIVFRITNQTGKPAFPANAQVGPMIRHNLASAGPKGTGLFRGASPNQFWVYTTTGGGANFRDVMASNTTPLGLPLWMKLVRMGNEYGVYKSIDGKEWSRLQSYSGGSFLSEGTYNMGIWLSSSYWTDTASVTIDNIYVGPPRLKYQSGFVGTSHYKTSGGWMQNYIHAIYADPAGRVFTNSWYDETDCEGWMIDTNGNTIRNIIPAGNLVAQGSVTGDGTYVYMATNGNKIFRHNPASTIAWDSTAFTMPSDLGQITGMAYKDGELYVSDEVNNRILVFDTSTLAEIPGRRFSFTQSRPGPMAVDDSGNLWIAQEANVFPDTLKFEYPFAAGVYCYTKTGTFTGRAITTGITSPTSICIDSTNRLLVCDNGPDQNIKIITNLDTAPAITGTFGQTGGIYSGSNPGSVNDGNAGGNLRFYGLTGVSTDNAGNIYVACNGAGADLRKFNSAGALQWRRAGLEFIDCADFDPESDGTQIYTREERMTVSYPATLPASGVTWSDQAITQHRFLYEKDERISGNAMLRRIAGQKFLITGRQGQPYEARIFRFDGEIAIPCARIYDGNGFTLRREIWTDADGDGKEDTGEIESGVGSAIVASYDIDSNGDFWMAEETLRRFHFQGLNSIGAPKYSFGHPDNLNVAYSTFSPDSSMSGVRYFAGTDTLYASFNKTGYSDYIIRRFDNFAAGGRTPAYTITLPKPSTDPTITPPSEFGYKGFDVATDKIFICELQGRVHVFDCATGAKVLRMVPGPEIGGIGGWQDMGMGLRAIKRSNGEYVAIVENSGNRAALLMYRFFDPSGPPPAIAWWKLDETSGTTANDSSGAGKHGTVTNGTWDPAGKLAGCLSLGGSTSRVAIPDDLIKNHTVLTVSGWFKSSSSSGGALLGYQDEAYPTTPTEFVPLMYVGTDGKLRGQFWNGTVNPITSTAAVNDGSWHHVALTGNGNTQTLYLDGVEVGNLSGNIDHASFSKNQLGVGHAGTGIWPNAGNGWRFLGGKLDDVRIYDRALTAEQVEALAAG